MKFIYFITFTLIVLLFVGGPDYESHRIFKYVWDMGHIFLFAALSFITLNLLPTHNTKPIKTLLYVIALSALVGLLIEVLQLLVSRDFELNDVVNDVLGAMIGYLLFSIFITKNSKSNNVMLSLILISLFIYSCLPLLSVVIDEYQMEKEFPMLANFETSVQLSRWDVNQANLSLSSENVLEGQKSLKVIFLPDIFSDIALQHFPGDWSNYKKLEFSIFNEEKTPIVIELKIYDKAHIDNGYKYNDRFNKEFILTPGWNNKIFLLKEIFNSPENRKMDKANIKSVSLFLKNISKPITLYLDGLKLS